MGKSSQLLGKSFELAIERACSSVDGLTLIKVDPHAQRGRAVKSKWLDYVGWYRHDEEGREPTLFTFDAKWIGSSTTFQRSKLNKAQQRYMAQAHDDGMVVFVLVGFEHEGQLAHAVVPWDAMPERGSVDVMAHRMMCCWTQHIIRDLGYMSSGEIWGELRSAMEPPVLEVARARECAAHLDPTEQPAAEQWIRHRLHEICEALT